MVDRITPEPTAADRQSVAAATGVDDRCPVVTEPFTEWALAGDFPGGRPGWESAGAVFTADVRPFEERKLWLLNGAHSLLAYAGGLRGHATVAEAVRDGACREWVLAWWDTCTPHLRLPGADVELYRQALLERFGNPRLQHRLEQIATDGSQKLPVRIVPVLRAERARGNVPTAAALVLAAWLTCLRDRGSAVRDVRAAELLGLAEGRLEDAARRVLAALGDDLGDDDELARAVVAATGGLRG
nr:hypothetical protein [Motilibacter aurantiacus]